MLREQIADAAACWPLPLSAALILGGASFALWILSLRHIRGCRDHVRIMDWCQGLCAAALISSLLASAGCALARGDQVSTLAAMACSPFALAGFAGVALAGAWTAALRRRRLRIPQMIAATAMLAASLAAVAPLAR